MNGVKCQTDDAATNTRSVTAAQNNTVIAKNEGSAPLKPRAVIGSIFDTCPTVVTLYTLSF